MNRHEYNVLPAHTPAEFDRLVGLIKEHGFNPGFPIVVYEGAILDGWHRYQACQELGVEPVFRELEGTDADALALVKISMGHRSLSTEQRAAAGVALLAVESERARERQGTRTDIEENFPRCSERAPQARDLAGEAVGVSGRTIDKAAVIAEQAPDVLERMKDGEYGSVERARRVSEMPDEQRTEVHQMMDSGVKAADAEKAVKPHVTNNSGDNEWYTPPKYIAAARAVMGGIDLDPASNEHANRTVRAEVFYDEQIDGLQQPWSGRVWLNPPYERGLIESFCERLVDSDEVTQACVLVNNATDTGWFRTLADAADAVCFLTGRISFLKSDGARNKPLQGQAVLYFGDRVNDFVRIFDDEFGHTWRGLT